MNIQDKTKTKRFIAGASCPSCNEIDSLVLHSEDQSIACVTCGYTQTSQQRDQIEDSDTNLKSKLILGDIKITRVE